MCMEVTGGRNWAKSGVSNNVIRDVIVDLATKLAEDLNVVCQKTLTQYRLAPEEVVTQIGGSVRVMELDCDRFLAGDIDLDWYDFNPDNQPFIVGTKSLVKENIFFKCTGEFRKKKVYKKDFIDYSYEAEKNAINWSQEDNIRYMKFPVKIIQGTTETNVEITAELKNVTSEIWHQGYKKGKRREIGGERSIWIPDEQLYMDICMRLCETKVRSKEVAKDVRDQEVALAVENKGLFIKKEIMEQCVTIDRVMQLAKDKLEANGYEIFCKVIECKTSSDFVELCREE